MATIKSTIELYDRFSAPMMNITSTMNQTVSAAERVSDVMNTSISTAGIDQATEAVQRLNDNLQRIESPSISAPDNVSVPVDVNATTTADNTQRIAEIGTRLNNVAQMQKAINGVGKTLYVLPDDAVNTIGEANRQIAQMQRAVEYLNSNPFDLDSDIAGLQIKAISESLDDLVEKQQGLDKLMGNAPSQAVEVPVNPVPPDPLITPPEPVKVPLEWQSDRFEVFTNTGAERFQNEIASLNQQLEELGTVQDSISQRATAMNLLPPAALEDIQALQNRIIELKGNIEQVENTSLDTDTDAASAQLEQLRAQMVNILNLQDNLNTAVQDVDLGNINAAYLQLSRNVSSMAQSVRDNFTEPIEIPVTWQSERLEVFTNTGIERFQLEVQNVNTQLNRLNAAQNRIAATAARTDLFPAAMVSDMNIMQVRLQGIQTRIEQIENNPLNMGTDQANAELEQLRAQLDSALQSQEDLNRAVEQMDVQAANEAYLRLSNTIGNTERYIRDNVTEQGQFNQTIHEGVNESNNLIGRLMGMVAAYASIQSIGKALNISDEFMQTKTRIGLMNDGIQTTDELIHMVYASAQDARGSFSDMADVVARFGNNAKDAFGSSQEVVQFANLIQKQMTIAGASTAEAANAELQLSQALGSGVLRGDELNSIFEQAPNLIQNIADYLDVPIGKIREMASEGQLSADVVKKSIFAAADQINERFEQMPMTWGQIWQSMQNTAMIKFQPIFEKLNEMANSAAFQAFVNGAISAMSMLAGAVLQVMELIGSIGTFVYEHWSIIAPLIFGAVAAVTAYTIALGALKTAQLISNTVKAAAILLESIHKASIALSTGALLTETAAQYGLNAALLACPITWVVLGFILLIAVIIAVVNAINYFCGTSISVLGVIVGAVFAAGALIYNLAMLVCNLVIAAIEFLINAFLIGLALLAAGWDYTWKFFANLGIAVAEFLINGWNTATTTIIKFFANLGIGGLKAFKGLATGAGKAASTIANVFVSAANMAIGAINGIIGALNNIPGVNIGTVGKIGAAKVSFDTSGIDSAISSLQNLANKQSKAKVTLDRFQYDGYKAPDRVDLGRLEYADIGSAYQKGYNIGNNAQKSLADFFNNGGSMANLDKWMKTNDTMNNIANAANQAADNAGKGADNAGKAADNAGKAAKALDVTNDELKYLRDIAERENVNRYTTASVTIQQTNNNTVSGKFDLDGIIDGLTDAIDEAVQVVAPGVHT